MDKNPLKIKYVPTVAGVIIFYVFMLFTLYLLFCKNQPEIRMSFGIFEANAFYGHISNFIISYNLVAIISFVWLLQGAPFRLTMILAAIMIAINFLVELFVRVLNTPDITDAMYGTAGALFAVIVIECIKRMGLKPYVINY